MDTGPCADCGELVTVQRRYKRGGGRRDHLCTPCAVGRGVAHMVAIHRRDGPEWDRYKARMLDWLNEPD